MYKYMNLYYSFPSWKGLIDISILQEFILRVDIPYRLSTSLENTIHY